MLNLWLVYALVATGLWGIWGFAGKAAARTLPTQAILPLSTLGAVLAFPVYLYLFRNYLRFSLHDADCIFALLAGISGAVGALFYYFSLSRGEASRVVVITATYPVVTVILAYFFLQEPLTIRKAVGVLLALAGIILLAV